MKIYTLRKSKHILRSVYHHFRRKKKNLAPETKKALQEGLLLLQDEVMNKNREKADLLAKQVEGLALLHLKKSGFDHVKELVFAIAFALIVAVLVRQMWFEFYEIPSGSMRPTFKEQDRLVVSKSAFGVNIPLTASRVLFRPLPRPKKRDCDLHRREHGHPRRRHHLLLSLSGQKTVHQTDDWKTGRSALFLRRAHLRSR